MAKPTTTFLDELTSAARGCVALVMGRREASSFFDFSQRGLVGSFIAAVLAVALASFAPMLAGLPLPRGAATQSVIMNAVLFAAQAVTAYFALRQMGRQDGFTPYLVASNWVTLGSALMSVLAAVMGSASVVMILLLAVFAILTFINIGRFIVTLTPMQIGLLFLSQVVGVLVAFVVIALLMGPMIPA